MSFFLHSNKTASRPPNLITSEQVPSLCLKRCSKIPVPTLDRFNWSLAVCEFLVQTQATLTTFSSPFSTTWALFAVVKHCSSKRADENWSSSSPSIQFFIRISNPPFSFRALHKPAPSSWPCVAKINYNFF